MRFSMLKIFAIVMKKENDDDLIIFEVILTILYCSIQCALFMPTLIQRHEPMIYLFTPHFEEAKNPNISRLSKILLNNIVHVS